MNNFFKWTFTVRRNGRNRPETDGEPFDAAAKDSPPVPENERTRPETQVRKEGDSSSSVRRQTRRESDPGGEGQRFGNLRETPSGSSQTASDIGAIADSARKQVRFLRRMNDLLKSRADGAYYL